MALLYIYKHFNGGVNMIPELQELYYYETDQERLDFDSDPVYQEKMRRALAELETEDLSPAPVLPPGHRKPNQLYTRRPPWAEAGPVGKGGGVGQCLPPCGGGGPKGRRGESEYAPSVGSADSSPVKGEPMPEGLRNPMDRKTCLPPCGGGGLKGRRGKIRTPPSVGSADSSPAKGGAKGN